MRLGKLLTFRAAGLWFVDKILGSNRREDEKVRSSSGYCQSVQTQMAITTRRIAATLPSLHYFGSTPCRNTQRAHRKISSKSAEYQRDTQCSEARGAMRSFLVDRACVLLSEGKSALRHPNGRSLPCCAERVHLETLLAVVTHKDRTRQSKQPCDRKEKLHSHSYPRSRITCLATLEEAVGSSDRRPR